MDKNSKIYIAGHRGLVGSAILRRLKGENYGNLVVRTSRELDLKRQADTERFFETERPECVFLAAAKVGGILANSTYKAEFIYDNLMIAANVIDAAYKYGVKKLLNLGSSCIYPKFAPQPLREEYLLSDLLEPTNEPYAIAKIAAIKLCRYYNEQYGTNFMSVMPTNLYGIGDNFNPETSHVLPALIRKMHLGKCVDEGNLDAVRKDLQKNPLKGVDLSRMRDDEIVKKLSKYGIRTTDTSSPGTSRVGTTIVELWGTGEARREFLYVDDVADAGVFLMENFDAGDASGSDRSGVVGEFVNIGTGEDQTIKELAAMVREVVGFRGEIVWDASKPDGTPRKLLDISRIKSFGWQPKTGLREGIRRTYEWYKDETAKSIEQSA